MTPDEQLQKWIKDDPQCPNENGDCCPDFSCCAKGINTPQEVKEKFAEAYRKNEPLDAYYMTFLAGMLAAEGKDGDVYIAGTGTEH